jgi:hypothetical protein
LRWHLDNPGAAARREALEEKGWRVPDSLYPPDVFPGTDRWLSDFWELGTDRPLIMGGAGPIPASSIDRHTAGWPEAEADTFRYAIRSMDRAFLNSLRPDGDSPVSDNPARDAFRAAMK